MPRPCPGRVGMVLETAFPPDARVEREALALIEAGYEVYLLCRKSENQPAPEEIYKGIHVNRVDPAKVFKQWSIPLTRFKVTTRFPYRGLYKSLWKRMTGMENDWRHLIKSFVRQHQVDILHVHDLKLLKTSLAVALREKSTKVIADLHENYPALIGHLTQLRKGKVKGLEKQYWWEKMERKSLQRVNSVIVVVEEARDRVLQDPSIPSEKVTIVRNVVDIEKFMSPTPVPLPARAKKAMEGRFVLCYVGHINSIHRGVHNIIEALPLLIKEIPNIYFVGAGTVRKKYLTETLQPLIEENNLEDYVYFTGYCDEIQFVPYIQKADICLCPHLKTTLTDTTFPNKIFLYSLFRKPVVVSSCLPLNRYITETKSGLVYPSGDKHALAKSILNLYRNPELRRQLGEQGHDWVLNRYCWEKEKNNLLEAYQTL